MRPYLKSEHRGLFQSPQFNHYQQNLDVSCNATVHVPLSIVAQPHSAHQNRGRTQVTVVQEISKHIDVEGLDSMKRAVG
jgi:hypothetical protein